MKVLWSDVNEILRLLSAIKVEPHANDFETRFARAKNMTKRVTVIEKKIGCEILPKRARNASVTGK